MSFEFAIQELRLSEMVRSRQVRELGSTNNTGDQERQAVIIAGLEEIRRAIDILSNAEGKKDEHDA
jgi:hypothetical protein